MSGVLPAAVSSSEDGIAVSPAARAPDPVAGAAAPTAVTDSGIDWVALGRDPEFTAFAVRKGAIVSALLAVSLPLFFAYPIVCGFAPGLLAPRVVGAINVGLAFTIGELLVAFALALLYVRLANKSLDAKGNLLIRRYTRGGGVR